MGGQSGLEGMGLDSSPGDTTSTTSRGGGILRVIVRRASTRGKWTSSKRQNPHPWGEVRSSFSRVLQGCWLGLLPRSREILDERRTGLYCDPSGLSSRSSLNWFGIEE